MEGNVGRVKEIRLSLPQDVVHDILVRLPAKTLVRFKCVCKSWCSMISDPGFEETHSEQLMSEIVILYLIGNGGSDRKYAPFRIKAKDRRAKKVDVLHFSWKHNVWGADFVTIYFSLKLLSNLHVYYILSHQRKQLHQLPQLNGSFPIVGAHLYPMMHQGISSLFYDVSRQEYKVVVLDYGLACYVRIYYCYVFTLNHGKGWKSENWRASKLPDFQLLETLLPIPVIGVLYWIARSTISHFVPFILQMDIRTEKFMEKVRLPCDEFTWSEMKRTLVHLLSEIKGSLCLIKGCIYNDELHIWFLKDSTTSHWIEQLKISHNTLIYKFLLSPIILS